MAQPRLQPVPPQLRAWPARARPTAATRSARCTISTRRSAGRYGQWSSLPQYVEEAQVQNYETQRAQFEAYIDHSTRAHAPSTGLVYWQLNKGWPTLLWDLYNNDYDQAGSYFGAQEANQPLHAIYAYDTGSVSIANLTGSPVGGLSVQARVYDLAGKLLDERSASGVEVASQGVAGGLLHPAVPADTVSPAPAQPYFVELLLSRDGTLVDRNVYWLSTQADVVNWPKTIGNPQATMTRYADLRGLRSAGPRPAQRERAHRRAAGLGGGHRRDDHQYLRDGRRRPSSSAPTCAAAARPGFLPPATTRSCPCAGATNDITLWPGESQTLQVRYRPADLQRRLAGGQPSGAGTSPRSTCPPAETAPGVGRAPSPMSERTADCGWKTGVS